MSDSQSELVAAEEAKRERNWNPRLRWQVIQDTITWAEAQRTVRRNTPTGCLAEQRRKLAELTAGRSLS